MISDIITIDNQGRGFDNALEEAGRVAAYVGLDKKNTTRLSLLTHEMLSLARSITGEMQADFWIEKVEGQFKMKIADNVKIGIRGRVGTSSSPSALTPDGGRSNR